MGQAGAGRSLKNGFRAVLIPRVVAALLIILSAMSAVSTTDGFGAMIVRMNEAANVLPVLRPVADFFTSYASQSSLSITMNEVVSDCYYTGGASKRTVSVEVSWTGLSDGQTITVSLPGALNGATTRVITQKDTQGSLGGQTVSPILTPQVVAFEIPSTFTGTLTATGPSGSAAAPKSINVTGTCEPQVCAPGTVGGMVFADYDRDGLKSDGELAGVAGVTITAYSRGGYTQSVETNSSGVWCMTLESTRYPVRIEFTNIPPQFAGGRSTVMPTDGSGTVTQPTQRRSNGVIQVISAPSQTIDLGVVDPRDYCQSDPNVFAPCYVMNDPLPSASAVKDFPVLVRLKYSDVDLNPLSSTLPSGRVKANSPNMMSIASAKEMGAIWALAYHRQKKLLFAAATLRRHSGYGPKGLGGIYVVDPNGTGVGPTGSAGYGSGASGNVKDSFSVEADLNVPVQNPASPIGGSTTGATANTGRSLPTTNGMSGADSDAFAAVGKVGIGGLALSEDGNKLFFVNQYDKKLYWIDITGYDGTSATRPGASAVGSALIPDPGCVGGNWRPSGVRVRKGGDVYVSGVCDALTSQQISDLRGNVQAYSPSANTWTQIFNFPLTYPKGASISVRGWKPWQDTISGLTTLSGGTNLAAAQPMFTDIAFDVDGAMVLGFNDRTGMQASYSHPPPSGSGGNVSAYVGGDLLRAFFSGSAFVLENAAKAGPNTGASQTNYEGPGFGEFYFDNWSGSGHSETFTGGIAIRPGSGEVISSAMDPVNSSIVASGLRINSNTTGAAVKGVTIYTAGDGSHGTQYVGKSTGVGDVELGCDLGGDLEIGNRIWFDRNGNGIQDLNEPGLGTTALRPNGTPFFTANVPVTLWKNGTQIGSTTANGDGYYVFNSKNSGGPLTENTDYEVRVDMSVITNPTFKMMGVSKKDAGSGVMRDHRDSDAELINGYAVIKVKTGGPGEVEHTHDIGFYRFFLTFKMSAIGNVMAENSGSMVKPVDDQTTVAQAGGGLRKATPTTQGRSGLGGISSKSGASQSTSTEARSYMVPKCLTPGGLTESMAVFANTIPPSQIPGLSGSPLSKIYLDVTPTVSAIYYPSAKLIYSATGQVVYNYGSISKIGNRIFWEGIFPAQSELTISYYVQAGDYNPGTDISTAGIIWWDADANNVIDESNMSNDDYEELPVQAFITCAPLGGGTYTSSYAPLSDQKAASVLIYNLYSSGLNPDLQNTRVTLTNVHPQLPSYVHLFFIDGSTCTMANWTVTLTQNQTVSLLMSDIDPNVTGYLIAVTVDEFGCPNSFNYLVGEALVKLDSGHSANLPAVGVPALLGGLLECGSNSQAELRFNGVSYVGLPRTLAVSSLMSRAEGNETMLVLNRIGGSLVEKVPSVGQLSGLLFNDSEVAGSFVLTGTSCQSRFILNNNTPRTSPRYDQLIPAGRTGWMRFSTNSDTALTGAVLNNLGPTRFSSGHNLHTLTLTYSVVVTMPIYPPNY